MSIAQAIRALGSHPDARVCVPGQFVVFWRDGQIAIEVFG